MPQSSFEPRRHKDSKEHEGSLSTRPCLCYLCGMNEAVIYTIGHSNHPIEYFLELLQAHAVDSVVDVRSVAASRFNPQYNKTRLSNFLKENGISYLHFAEEFGARRKEPELLDQEGKVDFEKVRRSLPFKNGVERLRQGVMKGLTIALMCAEAEPLDCHRFAMIAPALVDDGFEVRHILKDKSIERNEELEARMVAQFDKKLRKAGVVKRGEGLREAYRLKNREIGYNNLKICPESFRDEN
jgi:uncharacterized protein (DUF488 family)